MIFVVKRGYMYATKRHGFAMILAIFVILLVAGGGAMLLSNAARGVKSVGDNYLRAQAELLAQSATEFAVMRVQGFDDESGDCLNQLDITVNDASGSPMFDANVSITYSFRGAAPAGTCTFINQNTTQETRMLVDTTVTTRTDANLSTEPIRVHKRTWQKL